MDERFSKLLTRTCAVGCLLGLAGTVYLLAGLAGLVHSAVLNLTIAAVLVVALLFFLFNFFAVFTQTDWVGRSIWFGILAILMVEVLMGMLPPTSRDELTHHLAIPKLYAEAGRIIEVPVAPYAYYPMLVDMLYTPWIYWGYDFVPKWIHALYGALTALLLYAYLARRMNSVYGLLGAFFFLSTPVILRLSHWGYIDLAITFYTTAALLLLLRWRENRNALGALALAGLSLGFALATKPNGLVSALIITMLFALVLAKPPRESFLGSVRETALFGVLTAIPFLPWLGKNWWQTGNPFYPFFPGWFPAQAGSGLDVASFTGIGILAKRELLFGENIWQIVALPLRLFFSGQDDNPQFFDGVLTPVLILLLPWAFRGKWSDDKKIFAGFSLLTLLCGIFLVDLRVRYVLSIVPPLVILLVYGVFNIYTRIKRPAILFVGLLICAAWHGAFLWKYVAAAAPWPYLVGAESRDDYLTRTLPEYPAFCYINRETPTNAKIYLLFVGRRAYYCQRDYFHDGGELPGYLLGAIRNAKGIEQLAQSLRQKQITHLLIREDLLTGFLSNNLTAEQAHLWNEFAASRLRLKFREQGHAVYQLNG
jgi:dolichyl-phosphate-mannose-protein mannosyltransferase